MPQKPEKQPSFSIDDFIGEIEKAEDATLNKRLPQERLRNKRQLDNAARRAAEAAGLGDGKLKPQPLQPKEPKVKKTAKSPVTGMTLKSPKSKANSVDRIDFGGMGELQKVADQVGFSLDKLLSTKKVADFQGEVQKLKDAMGAFDQKVQDANGELDGMQAKLSDAQSELAGLLKKGEDLGYTFDKNGELVSVNFQKMQEAAAKYGITQDQLGQSFQNQRLHEMAGEIINDFQLLNLGGTETGTILSGMAPKISELVQQSIKYGTDIPANMKPWIENLIEAGKLTDENGNQITDLSKLKFGDPVATEYEKIQGAVKDLIAKMDELVGKISEMAARIDEMTRPRTVQVGVQVNDPNNYLSGGAETLSMGGFVGRPKYLASGGFIPRGTDTVPAMLTPGEGVLRRDAVSRLMRGDWPQGGGVTVSIDTIQVGEFHSESDAAMQIGQTLLREIRRKGVRLNAA